MFSKKQEKRKELGLMISIFALLLIGVLMVFDASVVYSYTTFGEKYRFLLLQGGWVIAGLLGMRFFFRLDNKILHKISLPMFLLSIVFLILVLLPIPFSLKLYGARRWFYFNPSPMPLLPLVGRLGFQPAELTKLSLLIYLGFFLKGKESLSKTVSFLLVVIVTCLLVLVEPDFGTMLIVGGIGIGTYFLTKSRLKELFLILPVILLLGFLFIWLSPYRKERLLTFFSPKAADPLSAGYHTRQIMIALGSGGLLGVGPGQSIQKYNYLPEVSSDSIFAVLTEEFGFIGASITILLFLYVIYRLFMIVKRARDFSDRAIAAGIACWFSLQTLLNLSSMVGVAPLTGVPLPLISYGGSALVFLMSGLGLALKISSESGGDRRFKLN